MSWWEWVLVGLAGAGGAPLRFVVDTLVSDREWAGAGVFPFGTLLVNATGSLCLGALTGLAMYHGLGSVPHEVLGTGLIGAYTTFSTFGFETVQLLEEGETSAAAANVVVSLVVGGLAAAAGIALAAL